ncbi:MAG: LLM class flavin-dependent oxidoreductase [Bauldia sp.]|nr:LLM class flavin-dependent oxidoreductase [Bauldia sp.]
MSLLESVHTGSAGPDADTRHRQPPSPLDFPDSPASRAFRQPLALGLFLDLYQRPSRAGHADADWTFESNLRLVQRAEALGFDLAFSRMQWLPKEGNHVSLDSFVTLAALAPVTKSMLLISSIHVLYGPWHPLHLAKFGATLDHITGGRWGINILTGHRAVEHEMFGWSQIEHDRRYELASELFDALGLLWNSDENIDFKGKSSWEIRQGFITPKPKYGRPVLVTATGSDAGIAFAARYSDLVFVTSPGGAVMENALATLPAHTARIKREAAEQGRQLRVLINPIIVSRETEAEAQAYADSITAAHQPRKEFASDAHAWRVRKDKTVNQGRKLGGNIEIVGTPEQVVDQLVALKKAGLDGIQIGFHDWGPDIEFFGERILPLLKQAGLRL